MRARLEKMGYTEAEIDKYIQDRVRAIDPKTISVAEDLNQVIDWGANINTGEVVILGSDPVPIGMYQDARHVPTFNQQFVQVTKRGNPKDTIMHEVGGHGAENFPFNVDKYGNPIYNETTLTRAGHNAGQSTNLGDVYYLNPAEQRARFLVTANQMYKEGYNPNSYIDFLNFRRKHLGDPTTTNVGQTIKYYDRRNI